MAGYSVVLTVYGLGENFLRLSFYFFCRFKILKELNLASSSKLLKEYENQICDDKKTQLINKNERGVVFKNKN